MSAPTLHSTADQVTAEVDVKKYNENDFVYAMERGQTYRGVVKKVTFKVDKTDPSNSKWKYYIHFIGWSSRHDRWLSIDDIRPDCEEYQIMAEESKCRLEAEQMKRKTKQTPRINGINKVENKRITASRNYLAADRKKGQRQQENPAMPAKTNSRLTITLEECCEIPFTLMALLKDEEMIINRVGYFRNHSDNSDSILYTPLRKIHQLPSKVSVDLILTQFTKPFFSQSESDQYERYQRFAKDMSNLFDSMLPKYLLYPCERTQYLCLPDTDKASPCKIYPAFHLLRLFVILPGVLSQIALVQGQEKVETASFFQNNSGKMIQQLIVFIQQHRNGCLKEKYRFPSAEEYTIDEQKLLTKNTYQQTPNL